MKNIEIWVPAFLKHNNSSLATMQWQQSWPLHCILNNQNTIRRSKFRCNAVRWKESRWSCLKWGSTNVLTFSESNHQDALFETKLVFCFYSLANFRGLGHRFGNVPYLIMVHLPNFFRWQRNYCFKNLVKKIASQLCNSDCSKDWLETKNYQFAFGSSLTH